jgi:cytoskeletal protein RodZ
MEQIGARLREARMRAKIDINQVESETKIRAKYLRAMENEEWELLPGEIYAKTFLRTYADYLGLDSREVVDDYRRQYERPTDHDLRPLSSGRERDRRPSGGGGGGGRRRRGQPQPRGGRGFPIPPWVIVVIVLVIVGVALYLVGTSNNNGSHTTSSQSKSGKPHKHHQKHAPKKGAKSAGSHHKAAPTSVHLSLVPTGTVYVCLVDGHGRKLIPGRTLSAGQKLPVQVGKTLLLTVGNNAVTITANGAKVPLAPSANPIGIKFTPGKHSPIPSAGQPTCT